MVITPDYGCNNSTTAMSQKRNNLATIDLVGLSWVLLRLLRAGLPRSNRGHKCPSYLTATPAQTMQITPHAQGGHLCPRGTLLANYARVCHTAIAGINARPT